MRNAFFAVLFFVMFAATIQPASAGDLFIYSKIGFMDWNETAADGKAYMSETGVSQELGVGYKVGLAGIGLTPSAAIWGGEFEYDGLHAETRTPWKTTTHDVGVKGNLDIAVPIHLGENFVLAPAAAAGVDYFSRSVGPEYWTVLTGKAGLRASYQGFTAAAGATIPYYTADHIDWASIGMKTIVTVRPKGQAAPYAEISYRTGKWEFGAYFEQLKWRASGSVAYKERTVTSPGAVLAVNGALYQPETVINRAGLSVQYHFDWLL